VADLGGRMLSRRGSSSWASSPSETKLFVDNVDANLLAMLSPVNRQNGASTSRVTATTPGE